MRKTELKVSDSLGPVTEIFLSASVPMYRISSVFLKSLPLKPVGFEFLSLVVQT